MRNIAGCLGIVVLVGGMSAPAFAEDWSIERVRSSVDVKGSVGEDLSYTSLKLWTTDMNQPEIRFSCSSQYGLKATITFEPAANFKDKAFQNVRVDARRVAMWIEDGEKDDAAWTIARKVRRIQTRSRATAARLYNAVVLGKAVTIDEPFRDRVTLAVPRPDDNFNAFARECYVTNGGN